MTYQHRRTRRIATPLLALAGLAMLFALTPASAKPTGLKAKFIPATGTLTVNAKSKDSEVVLYDDVLDQEIARQSPASGKVSFSFTAGDLPTIPCRIRAEGGGKSAIAKTAGASCAGAHKPLTCKITTPVGNQTVANGGNISRFKGTVKGAKSRSITYEWDFGGGADKRVVQLNSHETVSETDKVTFNLVRDTELFVTFTAQDISGARCADKIAVKVGNPPTNLPAKVGEEAPKVGDPNYVVIPFQQVGMAFHDLSYGYYSMIQPNNWFNAVVIKRGGGKTSGIGENPAPKLQTPEAVMLEYSAASSRTDPAGPDSINSTSRNYPVGTPYGMATVRKSDWFDPCLVWKDPTPNTTNAGDTQYVSFFSIYLNQKPAENRVSQLRPGAGILEGVSGDMTNAECVNSNFFYPNWNANLPPFDAANPATVAYSLLVPDAGAAYWDYEMLDVYKPVKASDPTFTLPGPIAATGASMPGKNDAYKVNEPQPFKSATMPETGDNYPGFDADRNMFAAVGFPQFPTDDKGRHNAYPMLRVQARDHQGNLLATTDGVTAVTTEFKCAECHTKGKNGADQSVFDGLKADMDKFYDADPNNDVAALLPFKGREKWIPVYVAPEDIDATRKNDRDVIEQASMINIARLHDFYYNFIEDSQWLGPLEFESEQVYGKAGEVKVQPGNCADYCHKSVPHADPRRYNMAPTDDIGNACPELSDSLHNIHGRLIGTMNADYTGTIDRDPVTRELKLADLTQVNPNSPPQFLLTVKDAGTPDDSCFLCHAGKQDKYQRDVMSAAGVNCIDCHGDLAVLAGGGAMVSRGTGDVDVLLDSRADPAKIDAYLNQAVTLDQLADAYRFRQSSYGPERDGTYFYMEKSNDHLYKHTKKDNTIVDITPLDMALYFLENTTGVTNPDGTYTLTEKVDGQPDVVTTLNDTQLLEKMKRTVNAWNLHFNRIPWAEQLSCANCHTGNGDDPVRRRAYDMTTGKFRLNPIVNERFAENLLPKKHDTSYTLLVENGQKCPPGTFSDGVTEGGKHVCERGLFKDSVDRHAKVPCEGCHGATHAVWPNPNPYANDNVTAMQLQGHTGTLIECEVCHQQNGSKDVYFPEEASTQDLHKLLIKGPHDMHPVNDPRFILNDKANETPAHTVSHGDLAKHNNSLRDAWEKQDPNTRGDNPDLCAACHGADHRGNRLAKTPIDRVLKVSDATKLNPAIKAKKEVKVKKGDVIGCDLCHSLETSFTLGDQAQ
jgi:hypothetical protein